MGPCMSTMNRRWPWNGARKQVARAPPLKLGRAWRFGRLQAIPLEDVLRRLHRQAGLAALRGVVKQFLGLRAYGSINQAV